MHLIPSHSEGLTLWFMRNSSSQVFTIGMTSVPELAWFVLPINRSNNGRTLSLQIHLSGSRTTGLNSDRKRSAAIPLPVFLRTGHLSTDSITVTYSSQDDHFAEFAASLA
jgi:hypothetical protein